MKLLLKMCPNFLPCLNKDRAICVFKHQLRDLNIEDIGQDESLIMHGRVTDRNHLPSVTEQLKQVWVLLKVKQIVQYLRGLRHGEKTVLWQYECF